MQHMTWTDMLNRCFDLHMWVPKVPCRLWFHSFENFEKGNGCHPIQKQLEKLTCHQVAWFAMAWTTMSHMQFHLDMSCFCCDTKERCIKVVQRNPQRPGPRAPIGSHQQKRPSNVLASPFSIPSKFESPAL